MDPSTADPPAKRIKGSDSIESEPLEFAFVEPVLPAGQNGGFAEGEPASRIIDPSLLKTPDDPPTSSSVTQAKRDKRYLCSECGRGFTTMSYLRIHVRSHTGERPYICEECGKQFTSASNLNGHYAVHREKMHVCEWCSARFARRNALCRHMIVHIDAGRRSGGDAGGRPYRCRKCGATFTRRSHLAAHRSLHIAPRDYTCGICGTKCPSRTDLVRHRRCHSEERPDECEMCGKTFVEAWSLRAHIRVHIVSQRPPKPYRCTECDRGYLHNSSLVRHTHDAHSSVSSRQNEIDRDIRPSI